MRQTLTISRDFLTNLGLDASVLAYWLGEERTADLCREVLEAFLVSFTRAGEPGESVRVTIVDSAVEPQAWEVVLEGEGRQVRALVREVVSEAGVGLELPPAKA